MMEGPGGVVSEDALLKELGELLRDLYRSLLKEAGTKISGGLTLPQFFLLGHVKFGFDTVSMLASHLRISAAAVSKMVDGIVNAGFLRRERSKKDRRLVRLILTSRGEEILRENEEMKKAILRDCFSVLTEKELAELHSLLNKVLQNRRSFDPEQLCSTR